MALVVVAFNDVVNITPGDGEEYARVLIGLFHQAGDSELARSFLRERRVPATVARRVYDKCADAGIRNEVLTHPGLGEERINKAAYNVLSAVEAGHQITGGDSVEPLCRVFSNQALTRDAIERAILAADRLPYSVLVPMLRGGALGGGDVRELWRSRAKEPASMLRSSFVEPAVRGGSAPSELVKQWLNDDRYAHVVAQYATCVSEDDVLRVAYDVRLDYGERVRALMNPALSGETIRWESKLRSRGGAKGLEYLLANVSAPPSLLEVTAFDVAHEGAWGAIAANPVATGVAFQRVLFAGDAGGASPLRTMRIRGAARNPGFPPSLVRRVYHVFGEDAASEFVSAPAELMHDLAQWHGTEAGGAVTATGCRVARHRNCPPEVRRSLVEGLKRMWPLVAYDAYRGRL